MFDIGLTDHLEGPSNRPSAAIFDEVAETVRRADELGVRYAWFAEHHIHAHHGHLPTPLLFALHLAPQTHRIQLGTAIICLNLHHPIEVAEQVAVADLLSGGRMAVGFGSGSTAEEFNLFGLPETCDAERHARFEDSLRTIQWAWNASNQRYDDKGASPDRLLPVAAIDLAARSWVAVNSISSARIAGMFNFNMLFSHLRTPEQYREYGAAYRAAGGTRLVAANRPVFVGATDADAFACVERALRILWRRFRDEGKIPADAVEPADAVDLCSHPINFIVGSAETVAREFRELHRQVPFDVMNVELRWTGLSHDAVLGSLQRLMSNVVEILNR
jgi:alkanesulfonate monooxygenase SsuD/methylene tetrahydromethanopterin reductase-like flavin-dependent oxidoreductase (luciferase family)